MPRTNTKKILIVDNSIHHKCERCSQFHRHFSPKTAVLHSIENPLPDSLEPYSHVILTGSAAKVDELSKVYAKLRPFIQRVEREGIPMLGICFGFQAIIAALSDFDSIQHYVHPEIGWTRIYQIAPTRLFKNLPQKFYAFENHFSSVHYMPAELRKTAYSRRINVQAFEHRSKPVFGVQFHPEYTTFHGRRTVTHWLKRRIPFRWFTNIHTPPRFSPEISERIMRNFYYAGKDFEK